MPVWAAASVPYFIYVAVFAVSGRDLPRSSRTLAAGSALLGLGLSAAAATPVFWLRSLVLSAAVAAGGVSSERVPVAAARCSESRRGSARRTVRCEFPRWRAARHAGRRSSGAVVRRGLSPHPRRPGNPPRLQPRRLMPTSSGPSCSSPTTSVSRRCPSFRRVLRARSRPRIRGARGSARSICAS